MQINSKLTWGVLNQCSNIIIPFLIILFSFKFLKPEFASIWVIFLSMTSIIFLFDFGLSPSIIRNVSYVMSGAQNLVKTGLDGMKFDNEISYSLLSRLLLDVKKIYLFLSFLALLIISLGGGVYFYLISPDEMIAVVLYSWFFFSSGLIISVFYLYYTPVLMGLGEIKLAYKANVIGRVTWLILSIAVFIIHPSIFLLSFSFLVSTLINRWICLFFYKKNKHVRMANKSKSVFLSTIPYIGHNAAKIGVVSLGAFLINRSTTLIAGIVCPIIIAGQFILTIQIFSAMLSISSILLVIKIPELSQAVAKSSVKEVKRIVYQILQFSLVIYIMGVVFFIFCVLYIFPFFNVEIKFLSIEYVLLLSFIYLLEMNHSVCANIITTKNKIPFVWASLISGISIVALSIILTFNFNYGIIGLILAQGCIQLLYNNWKWPLEVYRGFLKTK